MEEQIIRRIRQMGMYDKLKALKMEFQLEAQAELDILSKLTWNNQKAIESANLAYYALIGVVDVIEDEELRLGENWESMEEETRLPIKISEEEKEEEAIRVAATKFAILRYKEVSQELTVDLTSPLFKNVYHEAYNAFVKGTNFLLTLRKEKEGGKEVDNYIQGG